jgi:NDP-sugar pyrophosphorylase family protein
MKVLITTSGIGSRLGNLTKYTNKSLVRVGKKPALSYILDNYPNDTHFVITLGHYGDHVRQYIRVAHPELKVTFVEVDKYEGEGSSLLYSIYYARDVLNEPFIFHACDSVVQYSETPHDVTENWLGGFKSSGSSHYRTFNVNGDRVSRLNEKGEKTSDYDYIGVCGVRDHLSFWKNARNILNQTHCPSDYDAIVAMMADGVLFKGMRFKTWDDIGNMDSLKEARKSVDDAFDLLDKEDESIFMFDGKVIKFFYDEKVCANRVSRAKLLGELVPPIIAASKNFYAYKHSDGMILPKIITPKKMESLLIWAEKRLWNQVDDDGLYADRCNDFYKTKTIQRIRKFLSVNGVEDTEEIINGELIPPALDLVAQIDFSSLHAKVPTMFHGDFILENILETKDGFTLLDWRQDFGGSVEYGDFHYDLAKLNHNLTLDHSMVHQHLYYCVKESDGLRCQVLVPSINNDCRDVLKRFCIDNNIDYAKISVLTAIVWLNMSPLHEHPLDKFLYYFGRYHLHMALKGSIHV